MVEITGRQERHGAVVERQVIKTQSQIPREKRKWKMRYFLTLREVLAPTPSLLFAHSYISV